jgi:hypothetical protein
MLPSLSKLNHDSQAMVGYVFLGIQGIFNNKQLLNEVNRSEEKLAEILS